MSTLQFDDFVNMFFSMFFIKLLVYSYLICVFAPILIEKIVVSKKYND